MEFQTRFGAYTSLSIDGGKTFHTHLCYAGVLGDDHPLSGVAHLFGGISNNYHEQMVIDAGGCRLVEGAAGCSLEQIIRFAASYRRNDLDGMTQTSTGEWVLADDWDCIEASH